MEGSDVVQGLIFITFIQSIFSAAARLIAHLPKLPHISPFMIWLPLTARIQFKVLVLVLKSKLGIAPKYLRDHSRSPLSAVSHQSLCSLDRHTLFVPRVRTTMAQTRSFATVGPSLWNALPSSLLVTILSGSLRTPFSLLKTFFSGVLAL